MGELGEDWSASTARGRKRTSSGGWMHSRTLAAMDPEGRSPRDRLLILIHQSKILVEDGDVRGALAMARTLVDEARLEGDMALLGTAATNLANILLQTYDVDAALETLVPVRAAAAEAGADFVVAELDKQICEVLEEGARHEELLAAAETAIESAGRAGLGRWTRPALRYDLALITRSSATSRRRWSRSTSGSPMRRRVVCLRYCTSSRRSRRRRWGTSDPPPITWRLPEIQVPRRRKSCNAAGWLPDALGWPLPSGASRTWSGSSPRRRL